MFLSTPPSRVATVFVETPPNGMIRFYPRHPRGWRRVGNTGQLQLLDVSIHATLAGGDQQFASYKFVQR